MRGPVAALAWLLVAGGALAAAPLAGPPPAGGPLAVRPLAAGVRSASAAVPQACPEPVAVEDAAGPWRWRAVPGLEGVARALAADPAASAPLPGIGPPRDVLGAETEVWLLRDLECLDELGLGPGRPDWVAGVAGLREGWLALRADPGAAALPELRAVLRHELAHLALHRAVGGAAPRWLHEGYAQYASGSWNWQEAWRLRFVLLRRGGRLLEELSLGFPADPAGSRVAYLLSYTAVQELAERGGPAGLERFFATLAEGASVDAAMRRVYGLTEGQFEDAWRRTVSGRYGLLYLLSRAAVFWLAVALLVAWAGHRRRKHDRERLEAMKAEEEAHPEITDPFPEVGRRPPPPRGPEAGPVDGSRDPV